MRLFWPIDAVEVCWKQERNSFIKWRKENWGCMLLYILYFPSKLFFTSFHAWSSFVSLCTTFVKKPVKRKADKRLHTHKRLVRNRRSLLIKVLLDKYVWYCILLWAINHYIISRNMIGIWKLGIFILCDLHFSFITRSTHMLKYYVY